MDDPDKTNGYLSTRCHHSHSLPYEHIPHAQIVITYHQPLRCFAATASDVPTGDFPAGLYPPGVCWAERRLFDINNTQHASRSTVLRSES